MQSHFAPWAKAKLSPDFTIQGSLVPAGELEDAGQIRNCPDAVAGSLDEPAQSGENVTDSDATVTGLPSGQTIEMTVVAGNEAGAEPAQRAGDHRGAVGGLKRAG